MLTPAEEAWVLAHRKDIDKLVRKQTYDKMTGKTIVPCPTCRTRLKQSHVQKIDRGMVLALGALRKISMQKYGHGRAWLHVRPDPQDAHMTAKFCTWIQNRTYHRLWWFRLIKPRYPYKIPGFYQKYDKRHEKAGWWRVTELGEKFLQGTVQVKAYVRHICKQPCARPKYTYVDVHDAYRELFSFAGLMARSAPPWTWDIKYTPMPPRPDDHWIWSVGTEDSDAE